MFKWIGYAILFVLAWTAWRNGVTVPWIGSYSPPQAAITSSPENQTSVRVKVSAAYDNIYGEPWDGSNSMGGVMGPVFLSLGLSSPPDLTVCVVTADGGEPKCEISLRDGEEMSVCVDHYECDWNMLVPKAEPFSLVIFDMDDGLFEGAWDYIDAVFVSDTGDAHALEQLDSVTREFIEKASPTSTERPDFVPPGPPIPHHSGEKRRREKQFYFLSKEELGSGVSLIQSDILMVSS